MKWYKGYKDNFTQVEFLGRGAYELHLSPIDITPTEEEDADILYLKYVVNGGLSTFALKKALLDLQAQYDTSAGVNKFIIEGHEAWFPKADRVGLIHSSEVQKGLNQQSTTLWINNTAYSVDIDYLIQFLNELEVYAIECFNVTQRHINEIKGITDRDQIFQYNITDGYPSPIVFDSTFIRKD